MKCPVCASDSAGAYCPQCGTPLTGARCRTCGAALLPGANYCTQCGARATARKASGSLVPWLVAGCAIATLAIILAWPRPRADRAPAGTAFSALQPERTSASPPPLTGTPREQADRLFDRVMTERQSGDSARAAAFLPMAIQAYRIAGDLDADGLYHLSLLQGMSGDFAGARATAERILVEAPGHLLGLAAASSAARAAGDTAAARTFDERFLTAYDREREIARPEYQDHGRMLPGLRAAAERNLAARR